MVFLFCFFFLDGLKWEYLFGEEGNISLKWMIGMEILFMVLYMIVFGWWRNIFRNWFVFDLIYVSFLVICLNFGWFIFVWLLSIIFKLIGLIWFIWLRIGIVLIFCLDLVCICILNLGEERFRVLEFGFVFLLEGSGCLKIWFW